MEDGLPFPCQLLAARPSPRGSQLLPPPRRLRQFGFRKKHTRTQACELPTQPSVGFLLAGRSGRFTVRERRSGPRPCFSQPGFVPAHSADELGRVLLSCLPAPVPSCGMSSGSSSCVGWLLCPLTALPGWHCRDSRVQLRCLDISVLGSGLTHCAGLSGALGPCSSLELLLLPRILPSCIFSSFPPQGFQSNFSICGSWSRCARLQLSARAVVRDAGRRR